MEKILEIVKIAVAIGAFSLFATFFMVLSCFKKAIWDNIQTEAKEEKE